MVATNQLIQWCNQQLQPELFRDYAPNGLQVAGVSEIERIVSGVTACEALIDQAIAVKADALLVHHGYFWRGEDPCLVGMKGNRVAKLIKHDINLIAYHLPLDAHVEWGNNAQLARLLEFTIDDRFELADGSLLGFVSRFAEPLAGDALAMHIQRRLAREPLYIAGTDRPITTMAWCTGGAQDAIELAHAYGADAYLTGEVSERTVHFAREMDMHFYAAGHHATERYGVKTLGDKIAQEFGVAHQFIDIDNPV